MEKTEARVRDDLLGAGPKTVVELRSIFNRLQLRYKTQMEKRIQKHYQQQERAVNGAPSPQKQMSEAFSKAGGIFSKAKSPTFANPFTKSSGSGSTNLSDEAVPVDQESAASAKISAMTEGLVTKMKDMKAPSLKNMKAPSLKNIKAPSFKNPLARSNSTEVPEPEATIVMIPDGPTPPAPAAAAGTSTQSSEDGDWVGGDMSAPTDAIGNFSIGDEDDDDLF